MKLRETNKKLTSITIEDVTVVVLYSQPSRHDSIGHEVFAVISITSSFKYSFQFIAYLVHLLNTFSPSTYWN